MVVSLLLEPHVVHTCGLTLVIVGGGVVALGVGCVTLFFISIHSFGHPSGILVSRNISSIDSHSTI